MVVHRMKVSAVAVLLLALSGCSILPWSGERVDEVNLAFKYDGRMIAFPATLNGRAGTFFFASSLPRSIVSQEWTQLRQAILRRVLVVFGERASIHVSPEVRPLPLIVNGILGIDTWRGTEVTIDYRKQLLTVQLTDVPHKDMTTFPFRDVPRVPLQVDGAQVNAIVDTTLASGLVIPSKSPRADATSTVKIGGVSFNAVPTEFRDIAEPRVGNAVLEHFLLTINYRKNTLALWRDPRP